VPLVRFVGTSGRGDNTAVIRLEAGSDGQPRQLILGGDALEVSHDELKRLASVAGVEVIESEQSDLGDLGGDDLSPDQGQTGWTTIGTPTVPGDKE